MKDTTIEKYIIAYSNSFVFEGQTFSFRKKELFNITGVPKIIKRSNQGWWIGRVLLTESKVKELITKTEVKKDITELQWYHQEQLNHVFNL